MRPSLLVVAALASPLASLASASQTPAQLARAAGLITEQDIARHVGVIAHDSMGGRDTPSRGLTLTAQYVAEQFRRSGLKPGGAGGTWFDRYTVLPRLDAARSAVVFAGGGKQATASLAAAAYLARPSAPPRTDSAGIVVVSGRHTARALQQAKLTGKVVVYVAPPAGDTAGQRALVEQLLAASRGVVVLSTVDAATFANRRRLAQQQAAGRPGRAWEVHVRPEEATGLTEVLLAGGLDLARTRVDTTPLVRDLPSLRVSLALQLDGTAGDSASNVVGVLEGSDPKLKEEYVVISAHMDRYGMTRDAAGSIDNGADDNAFGVAGLIELAKAFSQPGMRPARSVVFLATSGTVGFQGSTAFARRIGGGSSGAFTSVVVSSSIRFGGKSGASDTSAARQVVINQVRVNDTAIRVDTVIGPASGSNPGQGADIAQVNLEDLFVAEPGLGSRPGSMSNVITNVNLDMIGWKTGDSIVVSGVGDGEFATPPKWVHAAHPELGLTLVDGGTAILPESDHFAFVRAGVPSLYFHNGTHGQLRGPDSPAALDAGQAARIVRLAFYVSRDIANAKQRPQWTTEGRRRYLEVRGSR